MFSRLVGISERLGENPWLRRLLFAAATLISILLIGYHFGTFDQVIHIPFLKSAADPTLYPNDPFVLLRRGHYSFFWLPFQYFYRLGFLEVSMFLVHLVATYLTFWAVWELTMTLFANPLAALLGVLAFVWPHIGFVGFPVIEFSLLNRTFVLPFLLVVINLYLKRKTVAAFFILGLAYNFHLLTANFVLAMLLFASVVEWRKLGVRSILAGLGAFVLGATPVLIWKASQGVGLDWSIRWQWFSDFTRSTIYNIYYPLAIHPPIILLTLGGVCAVLMFSVVLYAMPNVPYNQTVRLMLVADLLILVVQVITTNWLPITWIVQMQISRASVFILILTYVYFAGYLAHVWSEGELMRGNFGLMAGAFLTGLTPIFPMVIWGSLRLPVVRRVERTTALVVVVIVNIGVILTALGTRMWEPGIHVKVRPSPFVEAQEWARDNTPKDAVFITPPQEFGLYSTDWRVVSERSDVASLSEMLEVALAPQYYPTWKERFEKVAPGTLSRFHGDFFENQRIVAEAFDGLPREALQKIACDYHASYLVLNKPFTQDFPVVYANKGYTIYDLHAWDCK